VSALYCRLYWWARCRYCVPLQQCKIGQACTVCMCCYGVCNCCVALCNKWKCLAICVCVWLQGGPYHNLLHGLLGAYACYRPDVGYVCTVYLTSCVIGICFVHTAKSLGSESVACIQWDSYYGIVLWYLFSWCWLCRCKVCRLLLPFCCWTWMCTMLSHASLICSTVHAKLLSFDLTRTWYVWMFCPLACVLLVFFIYFFILLLPVSVWSVCFLCSVLSKVGSKVFNQFCRLFKHILQTGCLSWLTAICFKAFKEYDDFFFIVGLCCLIVIFFALLSVL